MASTIIKVGDPFESCHLKLDRAKAHFDTLESELRPWCKNEPYRIIKNYDPDARRHVSILELQDGKGPDLERWSLLSADCIHNLRTALDHLAYGVAIVESGWQDPPPSDDKIQFPIADNSTIFVSAMTNYKLDSVRNVVRTAIESVQPYKRPNPLDTRIPALLSLLRDLENRDKHRLLHLITQQAHRATIDELRLDVGVNVGSWQVHIGPLEDRTEILSFTTDKPTPDVKYKTMVEIVVCVRYGKRTDEFIEVCTLNSCLVEEVSRVIAIVSGSVYI